MESEEERFTRLLDDAIQIRGLTERLTETTIWDFVNGKQFGHSVEQANPPGTQGCLFS